MLRSVLLVGAALALMGPALAETCGTAPVPPDVPGVSALSGKTTDEAKAIVYGENGIKAVKAWQALLGPFRDCLKTQTAVQKQAADDAKAAGEKTKAATAKTEMERLQTANDKTVDDEEKVVGEWVALHEAYCKMGDGLAGCPKKK